MVETGTDVVQVWFGLHAPGTQTASPASATAGEGARSRVAAGRGRVLGRRDHVRRELQAPDPRWR